MFARQRKCSSIDDIEKFVNYLIYRKLFNLQKFIWQNKGTPSTASAGERPVSSLRCDLRLRRTQGISSVQVAQRPAHAMHR
jgi:hypothetical protein